MKLSLPRFFDMRSVTPSAKLALRRASYDPTVAAGPGVGAAC